MLCSFCPSHYSCFVRCRKQHQHPISLPVLFQSRNTIRAHSLETALNGTGIYTMVSAKKVNGAWNIYSTLNDGKNQTETIILSTAKENYANYTYLGAGNDPKGCQQERLHHGLIKLQRIRSLGPPMPQLPGTIWRNQLSAGMDRQPPIGNLRQMQTHLQPGKRNHHKRRKEQKRQAADAISGNLTAAKERDDIQWEIKLTP